MKLIPIVAFALLLLLEAASGQHTPETEPRPAIEGYTALKYSCNPAFGAMHGEFHSGKNGTLKACAKRCSELVECNGFNFLTDYNECTLFSKECLRTFRDMVDSQLVLFVTQNYYLKGVIECPTSTVGNEFFLAFMANDVTQPKNMPLEIWMAQDENLIGSTVHVQFHHSVDESKIQTEVHVPPKQAVSTVIPGNFKISDLRKGVTIERKAMRLYSDNPFVVYGVNKEYFTTDAFMGIPSRLLGNRYIAVCHWPPSSSCEFAIAAIKDNTTVKITLPLEGAKNNANLEKLGRGIATCSVLYKERNYTNGQSFRIALDRFEVAQVQDICDLTGSIIEADHPIAVWSGDSRVNVGKSFSRDHLVDQLFSVDNWGDNCAAWPTPNRVANLVDNWVITAADDNTVVYVDSSVANMSKNFTLDAGQSIRFAASSVTEWMNFRSDKKFQAIQFAHSAVNPKINGDPSMTVCIPSSNFGYGYDFVAPKGVSSEYDNYLTLITRKGTQNGFILDDRILSGIQWNRVPNSDYIGGYIKLDTKTKQTFRIEHKIKGVAFEAYIYGAGDRESYAYPGGACIRTIDKCTPKRMNIADGKDNDCDGMIDEERCDDDIDNDMDGEIDEDCYIGRPTTTAKPVTVKVYVTHEQACKTTTTTTTTTEEPCHRRTTTTTTEQPCHRRFGYRKSHWPCNS